MDCCGHKNESAAAPCFPEYEGARNEGISQERSARIARRVLGRTHAKIKDTPTINTSRALQKYSRQR
jgi:hypothetical protein